MRVLGLPLAFGLLLAGAPAVAAPPGLGEVIEQQLAAHDIPGAAVVTVSGGEVTTAGHGMSDRTVFPIDSVTKVVTATAVMRQVERGDLDLDTDVNRYLRDMRVADTYPGRPVTLRHLLTHTAGFEEQVVGALPRDPDDLAGHLAAHQPARVRPPGELPAYSNYGLALAGLIAAQGQPFERHIVRTILAPLGMRASTFEPPDTSRAKDLLTPAGGLWSTVGDMGRFLTEHLGGRRVLDTTRMHIRAFGTDPRLPGSALGLQEWYHGHTRMLGHAGDGPGSHSALVLIPERNAGIFVVFNGDGADGGGRFAVRQVVRAWAESLAPRGNSPDGPPGGAGTAPAEVAGSYRSTRMNRNDFSELFLLLGSTVTVSGDARGITTTGLSLDPNSTEQRWRPVRDGLFRGEHGQLIAFTGDRLLVDGTVAYERMAWYEDPSAHLLLMAIGLLLLATTVAWPVAALWRGRRGPGVAARVTAGVTAALAVTCAVGLTILGPAGLMTAVLQDAPVLFWVFAPLTLAAVGALATAGYAVAAWRRRWWSRAIRLHYTAVAVGGLLLVAVSHLYRLTTVPFV